jgi:hypothetical protein
MFSALRTFGRALLPASTRSRRPPVSLPNEQVVSFHYERTPEWWTRTWVAYSVFALHVVGTYVLFTPILAPYSI